MCATCGPAWAAPARIRFHVEPKRYSEALLDVAQQANVTLIGAGACEGMARGVSGTMSLEQALGRLLDGASCSWRMAAPGAVEILGPATTAAAARPASPTTVSELLVTATKRVRDPRQLAVAVSAVPGRELKATGAADAGDAAAQLAGVLATNLGPGRNKLLLRGLSDGAYTGRTRSTVATYLGDIPVNYNAPDPDLRLVDVERVEVARGPQGALYGAGSLSGVYRIVARQPDTRRFSTELRGTLADTRSGAISRALEGFANLPLWGFAGLRLSGYDEVQGGYLDDINLGREDVDRTERRGGRVSLLLQPDDSWSLTLTGAGQRLRSDDTHYTTPGLGLKRSNRIIEPHINDIYVGSATLKRSWGWGEFTSSSGYVRHAYGSFYDATAVQHFYTSFATTSAYSERNETEMFVQDVFLASRGARRLEWLVGLYGSHTRGHSPTELLAQNPFAPDVMVYADDRRDRIRELAAYGEASYRISPEWTVAVGGRLFHHDARTRSDVVSERFDPRSFDRTSTFTSFAPKISIQREFGDGGLIYAVISEGYRGGGINSGGARPLATELETFGPDRLRNYEVGLKTDAWDRRAALTAAAFYDVWRDIQTDQFRPSGIPFTTNAGDAHILGLESELSVRWNERLTTQLNGRLARTRTTNPNPNFAPELVDGLPGAPAVSGAAVVTYERPVSDEWRLRLVGETSYVGRSQLTWNRPNVPKMGGYVRTKLLAELSRRNLGVQVFVTNPEDAFSDTFAFGNPFNPDQVRQVTPQRPRTVGVTLFAAY